MRGLPLGVHHRMRGLPLGVHHMMRGLHLGIHHRMRGLPLGIHHRMRGLPLGIHRRVRPGHNRGMMHATHYRSDIFRLLDAFIYIVLFQNANYNPFD